MTIREKFDELIKGLVSQQVITESQSSSFEPIITQFETLVKESETKAIKAAAQVTESRMAEYDNAVKEQLQETFKQLKRHNVAEAKLEKIKTTAAVEAKIVGAVDAYLNEYVKRILPKGLVIDYDRLQRLEEMHSKFKTALIINDSVIYNAAKKLKETVETEIAKDDNATQQKIEALESQVAELLDQKNKLEQEAKVESRNKILDAKLQDVPALEAKKVRKYFQAEDATSEEVEADFDQVLAIVKKALDIAADAEDDDDSHDEPSGEPSKADIQNKIANILGSKFDEEKDGSDEFDPPDDDDAPKDDDSGDDDAEEEPADDEEGGEDIKDDCNESIRKKSSKKLIKESYLMRSYINNYQKLNS